MKDDAQQQKRKESKEEYNYKLVDINEARLCYWVPSAFINGFPRLSVLIFREKD